MTSNTKQRLVNTGSKANDIFSTDSNYALFVGKNFKFYSEKWNKILNNKCHGEVNNLQKQSLSHASFNLAALIFGVAWLAYRKMYLNSLVLILAMALLPQIGWVLPILLGMYGNKLYFRFVDKKLQKLEKDIANPDVLKTEIIQSGSTSKLGFSIAIIAIVAAVVVTMAVKEPNLVASVTDPNSVSYSAKETINSMSFGEESIKDVVAQLAGASGKVEWKRDKNDYYVYVIRSEATCYLKFSHNENTDYIILSEVGVNDRVCEGSSEANYCLSMILKEVQ